MIGPGGLLTAQSGKIVPTIPNKNPGGRWRAPGRGTSEGKSVAHPQSTYSPRACAQCGAEFTPNWPTRMYCSPACSWRHNSDVRDRTLQAASGRRWRAEHSDHVRQRDKAAYQRHRQSKRDAAKAWYEAHAEQMRQWQREYRDSNKDAVLATQHDYYQRHAEESRSAAKARRLAHPTEHSEYAKRKRARRKGAQVCDFTRSQWEAMKAAFGHRCVYCGNRPPRLTQDHLIPLSKGGDHTRSNIVPACGPCNSRKHVGPPPPFVVEIQ